MKLVWTAIVGATLSLALPAWAQEQAVETSQDDTSAESVEELTEEEAAEEEVGKDKKKSAAQKTDEDDDKKEGNADSSKPTTGKQAAFNDLEKLEQQAEGVNAEATEASSTKAPEAVKDQVSEAVAGPTEPAAAAVAVKEELEKETSFWDDMSITFGNKTTLRGADTYSASYLSEDFTNFDPRYSVSLTVNQTFKPTDFIRIRGSLGFTGEVTQANSDPSPWNVSDLLVNITLGKKPIELPADISLSGYFTSQVALSEYSIADGKLFAQSGTTTLSRRLDVLKGLTLSFSSTAGYVFRQSTMAGTPGYDLGTGCSQPAGTSIEDYTEACDSWESIYSGAQGSFGNLGQVFSARLGIDETYSLSASYSLGQSFLYSTNDFSDQPVSTTGGYAPTPSTIRFSQAVSLGVSVVATSYLNISLGVSSGGAQLSPDGSYYTPLFNRHMNAYLNLTLTPADLLADGSDS
ncbi:MAG: hypothetical protein VX834_00525 [Myxococcota bacterium]|nr:hypothetical protein [Myxococcota bacterium]